MSKSINVLRFSALTFLLIQTTNGECKDKSTNCAQWKIDYGCNEDDWKDFMTGYCQKTCGVCVPTAEDEKKENEVVDTKDKSQKNYEEIMNSKFQNKENDNPNKIYTEDGRTDDEYIMHYYPNKDFKCADYSTDCDQWTRTYKCDSATWGRHIRLSCPESCNLSYCKGKFSEPTHKSGTKDNTKKDMPKIPKTITENDADEKEVQTQEKNNACMDKNKNCAKFIKYCTSTTPKYRNYMKDNCAKSCNFCQQTEVVKPSNVDSVTNPLKCTCTCTCNPKMSDSANNGCNCSCSCNPQ